MKSDHGSILGLSFSLTPENGKDKNALVLVIEGSLSSIPVDFHDQFSLAIDPSSLLKPSGWVLLEAVIHMPRHIITGIHAICCTKPEPMLAASIPSFQAELGHLAIVNFDFPQTDSPLSVSCQKVSWVLGPDHKRTVNAEICWEAAEGVGAEFLAMWYNIYACWLGVEEEDDDSHGGTRYLGLTRLQRFYVSDLDVPAGTMVVRFMVQACRFDGTCQKLDQSPFIALLVDWYAWFAQTQWSSLIKEVSTSAGSTTFYCKETSSLYLMLTFNPLMWLTLTLVITLSLGWNLTSCWLRLQAVDSSLLVIDLLTSSGSATWP